MGFFSMWAGTVTIPDNKRLPPPPHGFLAAGILKRALCQSDGRQNGRRGCAFDNELKRCQHQ